MAGGIPGAVRTAGGHWKIPDSPEVRKWCSDTKKQQERRRTASERKDFEFMGSTIILMKKKGMDFEETHRVAWVAGMRRRITAMRKAIEEGSYDDLIPPKSLSLQIRALGELLIFQSERWDRGEGAV